jgi:hypothetical protein
VKGEGLGESEKRIYRKGAKALRQVTLAFDEP